MWKPKIIQKITDSMYVDEYEDVYEDDYAEQPQRAADAHYPNAEQPPNTPMHGQQHHIQNDSFNPHPPAQHPLSMANQPVEHAIPPMHQAPQPHLAQAPLAEHIPEPIVPAVPEAPEAGELSIDLYQTPEDIVIRAMIAGVPPHSVDLSLTRDMLTISGSKEETKEVTEDDYFYRELYWGTFTRTIMLPSEIEVDEADAQEKHGILTIRLPKINKDRQAKIKVKSK